MVKFLVGNIITDLLESVLCRMLTGSFQLALTNAQKNHHIYPKFFVVNFTRLIQGFHLASVFMSPTQRQLRHCVSSTALEIKDPSPLFKK
jgi:hypothetical protein